MSRFQKKGKRKCRTRDLKIQTSRLNQSYLTSRATAMSTPPLLPVTNQQAVQAQPPINTPAFHTFFSRLSTSIRDGLSQRRPWAKLVDRSSMARPESLI
ncbi:hypothetical protein HID58_001576 [Brassica napus]|uniref:Uncharacterized protein n=1 Tax=Brassica napus TaxID=3708 RepID=A0ABQ8EJS9_BRANA|nr:hypothetical protein HID58_001576 [Brassica napus]